MSADMNIKIELNTGNATFEDNPQEVFEVLQKAAQKIVDGMEDSMDFDGAVRDSNGNKVLVFKATMND